MFLSGLPTTVRHVCNYNKVAQVTLLIGDDEKKNTLTELGCNQWLSFPPFYELNSVTIHLASRLDIGYVKGINIVLVL